MEYIQNYLNKISKLEYIDELYCGLLCLITLVGWLTNQFLGMSVLIIFGVSAVVIKKDLRYFIPCALYFIFNINEGFSSTKFPIPIIVEGAVLVIVLIVFLIKNGINANKMHFLYGLSGLAIMNFLPIFWNSLEKRYSVYYFLYFSDLAYLLIYIVMSNGIKSNSSKTISVSMSWLSMLMFLETLFSIIKYRIISPNDSIFSYYYFFGWGLCNEAGIMICMASPFIFYLIASSHSFKEIIYQFSKVVFSFLGVIFTTSRGSIIFFVLSFIICSIYICLKAKRKKNIKICYGIIGLSSLALMLIFIKPLVGLITKYISIVFENGLDDNYRFEIWQHSLELFSKNPLTIILGSGITSNFGYTLTAIGYQHTIVVSHSTIFQTMVMGGLLGITCLGIHLYEKYRNLLYVKDKTFVFMSLISFIVVGIYGLIDNTYHMYYYMITLVIILASIDSQIEKNVNEKNMQNLEDKKG